MAAPAFVLIRMFVLGNEPVNLFSLIFAAILVLIAIPVVLNAGGEWFGWRKTDAEKTLRQPVSGSALPPARSRSRAKKFYRLKPDTEASKFWEIVFFALFWNGVIWGLFVRFLASDAETHLLEWALISPFIAIGFYLVYRAGKSLAAWLRAYSIVLEVDQSTAVPGQVIQFQVTPGRHRRFERLSIGLLMQEKATCGAGSSEETKDAVVRVVPVCDLEESGVRAGPVLTAQSVTVPPDAFPSFQAKHNVVRWVIRLMINRPGKPRDELYFPIRVVPAGVINQID